MIENKDVCDRKDGDVQTAVPDGDLDTDFEPPVGATNVLNGITRLPDTVNLLHQSMVGSQVSEITKALHQSMVGSQVSEITKALHQSMVGSEVSEITKALHQSMVGSEVSEITKALDRSLAASQVSGIIKALDQSLAASQVSGIIKALDQSLAASQVSGIIKALDQSLAASQVSGIIKALDQSLAASQVSGIIKALDQSLAASQRANALSKERDDAFALSTRRLRYAQEIQKRPASFVERRADEHLTQGAIWFDPRIASVVDTVSTEESQLALIKYDMLVTEDGLHQACRSLFRSGHYAEAVRMAFTYLDNMVREKSGHAEKDGADLMRFVFSADRPLLKLNDLETRSDRNEQQGYMQMLAGAMIAIRNPRSHEHDLTDRPEEALEMLVMANHFIRMLNKATPT